MMIGIEELSYFVPQKRVSISDLASQLELSPKDVFLHTTFHGQKEIAYDPAISLIELLQGSLDMLFEQRSLRKYKITHLLYTHTIGLNQDVLNPLLGKIIKRYGLSECSAVGITQANCASGIMALEYARNILASAQDDEAVIVLCGDRTMGTWHKQVGNTITGDGSAAMLLVKNASRNFLVGTKLLIDSRYYRGFYNPSILEAFSEDHNQILSQFMSDSLADEGKTFEDLKFIIPHNTNRTCWLEAAKNTGFDRNILYLNNVPKFGHTFTADNFINYATALEEQKIQSGDLCLAVSLGSGFYYASALIRH